jgi:cell division septation protein DedD
VGDARGGREVRLEGAALGIATVLLAALLGGAFWLGRVYERIAASPLARRAAEAAGESPSKGAAVPRTDDLSFFDTLSGPGQEAEPARQASRAASAPPPPVPTTRAEGAPGPWFVQVFAGRDRRAAEQVVKDLDGRGHPVRLESEREGAGSLFKVRVGGFASREAAETAAGVLRGQGQAGAWVVRAGG